MCFWTNYEHVRIAWDVVDSENQMVGRTNVVVRGVAQ